jgi:FkbM family methyltransferase
MKLRRFLREIKEEVLDIYSEKSYSQEGEDMILRRILGDKKNGFYIDVGAHHPKRFSNTYLFYKKGWSGINIDAAPGSMAPFKKARTRDINLELAIAKDRRELTFYIFNEPALNSFDEKLSYSRINDKFHIIEQRTILTQTLEEILRENISHNQKIDFLSTDVEGLDLEVLQSNNWNMFRPEYILVECLNLDWTNFTRDSCCKFLIENGYIPFAKTVNTTIFREA